ncbi:MAG TPA: DUF305 domain-containing protein [Crinalium sp.]
MRKIIASFLVSGVIPLAAFGLTACSDGSAQNAETTASSSPGMAQMDHGSMSSPGSSSPAPMDHASMSSMDLGPADEIFDLRFIDAMIPHHEGAVAMAREALQKSNRPEIKQLAQAIIEAQEKEISALKQWRQTWYPRMSDEPIMYSVEMGHTMPMTDEMRSSMMMNGDLGAADDQFDLRFINAMIPHHEGAIEMAGQALEKSDRPEIIKLAQDIIDSQQQEVEQMQQWRQNWYGQ